MMVSEPAVGSAAFLLLLIAVGMKCPLKIRIVGELCLFSSALHRGLIFFCFGGISVNA